MLSTKSAIINSDKNGDLSNDNGSSKQDIFKEYNANNDTSSNTKDPNTKDPKGINNGVDLADLNKSFQNNDGPDNEDLDSVAKSFHNDETSIFSNFFKDNPVIREVDPFKGENDTGNNLVNNINIGSIPEKESEKFINNNYKMDRQLMVKYNNGKFTFFDEMKNFIGAFTIDDMVKYFGQVYDTKDKFMSQIKGEDHKNAVFILKNFIGYPKYDKESKFANIVLFNHNESPFMGDIKMIMYLNNALHDFEKEKLYQELEYVSDSDRQKIEGIIKQLIFVLLNYTLGLVYLVSENLKGQPNKNRLKESLIRFSVNLVFRISKFVQSQVKVLKNRNTEVEKLFQLNNKLKNIMISKFDNYIEDMKDLQDKMVNLQSGGGENNNDKLGEELKDSDNQYDKSLDSVNSSDSNKSEEDFSAILEI